MGQQQQRQHEQSASELWWRWSGTDKHTDVAVGMAWTVDAEA